MKTAKQWMEEIENLYEGQKTGRIKPPQACEMNNTIGKAIAVTKLAIDGARFQRELGNKAPDLPMIDAPKEP